MRTPARGLYYICVLILINTTVHVCPHTTATPFLFFKALLDGIQKRGLLVGTDVYDSEPGGNEVVKFENSLARHPSVVSTHHTAAATTQAQEAVGQVLLHVIHTYTREDVVLNQVLL